MLNPPNNTQNTFMLALVMLAIIGFLWLFLPFLPALFFALLVAIASYDYYQKLCEKTTQLLAAALMCFFVTLVLILPIFYILLIMGFEASKMVALTQMSFEGEEVLTIIRDLLDKLPLSKEMKLYLLSGFSDNIKPILLGLKDIILFIFKSISYISFNFLIFVIISIFTLFYLYLDGRRLAEYLKNILPLEPEISNILMVRFSQLAITLVSSVFFIAFLQGLVFGLGMFIINMPALFFGTGMAIASFIPVLGGLIIWLPMAVYFIINGQIYEALLVIILGAVIVGGVIDNMIRPWFISKISQKFTQKNALKHTLITVLSTLAGIVQLGILGLFVGPIIAAMAISIFDAYALKYRSLK